VSEYLVFPGLPGFEMPRIEELILKKSILNPGLVAQAVGVAMMHLSTHPGPNLEKRRRLVYDWLGLWDLLLKGLEDNGDLLGW
jgi:hypothetical protein